MNERSKNLMEIIVRILKALLAALAAGAGNGNK